MEELRAKIEQTEMHLEMLKSLYDRKRLQMQMTCRHEEFMAEDNGDYHKPGYYYTCAKCGYFTNIKPSNNQINYAFGDCRGS